LGVGFCESVLPMLVGFLFEVEVELFPQLGLLV
jgi:hypothetical protein